MSTVGMLTQKEKELVAVAASIASGCVPCTTHYLKSVRRAGGSETEILRAITIALDVRDHATEMMAEAAQGNLGYEYPENAQAGSVEQPIDYLIAIGASLACNSVASLEYYWTKAKLADASIHQILQVIGIVRDIRKETIEKTDAMIGSLLDPFEGRAENTKKQKKSIARSCSCS